MIAIVDDEECVRKALGRLLRSTGFEVHTFASGPEFLDSLNAERPACTILDLHLPELSGLEVQTRLTEAKVRFPCIIITGNDEPGTKERVLAAGAAEYLRKPVDERILLGAINSVLHKEENLQSPEPFIGESQKGEL